MGRRLKLIAGIVAATALIPLSPARACSCYLGDPRDAIDEASAAVIATYISRRPVDPQKPHLTAIYTFRVDEEIKGEFEETVEVRSHTQGTACGLSVEEGRATGLLLYATKSGAWTSSSCSQMSPEKMREAASALPKPDGKAPGRFVVGGSFHNEQSVMLDAEGRIVHYGGSGDESESEVVELAACPGGERIVEVAYLYPNRARLVIRDTSRFNIERSERLPFGRRPYRQQHVSAVTCRDPEATDVYVFSSDHEYTGAKRATSYLVHYQSGGIGPLVAGEAREASFTEDHVWLSEGRYGRRLIRQDLDTGERTFIAKVPPGPGPFTASPDGQTLAAVAQGKDSFDAPASRIVLVRLADGNRVVSRSLHQQYIRGEVRWLGPDRLVMLADYNTRASRLFDGSLNVLNRLRGWDATDPVIVDTQIFGLRFDYDGCFCASVAEYDIETEEIIRSFELPTTVTYSLLAI